MAYSTIKVAEAQPGVTVVTFARPEVANALSTQMGRELLDAWSQIRADQALRCVVLAGEGKHFQAGADLKERNGMTDEAWAEQHRLFEAMIRAQLACPVPVIAAVQGAAMGGGCEMALASDIVIAADDVRFRQLEIGRGIVPFGGATFRAPAQLGWGNAMRFLLTAEEFGAAEALRIGLVQEVVPVGTQLDRARAIAALIAKQAPLGVQATLANARIGRSSGQQAAADHIAAQLPGILASSDAMEGLRSFLERRDADFKGR
jgi:enoyl-CoA hydratase/carnithine racemase